MRDDQKLRELLERVSAASGADRDIDVAIARHFGTLGHAAGMSDEGLVGPFSSARRYTASIDASIALVERMLPGWDWVFHLSQQGGREFSASVIDWDGDSGEYVAHRPTAPLAVLSALLRALISQAEGEGQHGS